MARQPPIPPSKSIRDKLRDWRFQILGEYWEFFLHLRSANETLGDSFSTNSTSAFLIEECLD